jgi:hypothetical protein
MAFMVGSSSLLIDKTRGDDQDLGRVGITHPQLNNPIVVPLQKWPLLNSNTVMDNIERVLNSEENLPLDAQMQITIGSIYPFYVIHHRIRVQEGPFLKGYDDGVVELWMSDPNATQILIIASGFIQDVSEHFVQQSKR